MPEPVALQIASRFWLRAGAWAKAVAGIRIAAAANKAVLIFMAYLSVIMGRGICPRPLFGSGESAGAPRADDHSFLISED
jgi:hypothetical protein